jgi:ssDNA-binding Zn-finger/Zn-ribbon topoisomerase 1
MFDINLTSAPTPDMIMKNLVDALNNPICPKCHSTMVKQFIGYNVNGGSSLKKSTFGCPNCGYYIPPK